MNRMKQYGKKFGVRKNPWLRFASSLLPAVVLLLGQGSCAERPLDARPTQGHVVIHASWNSAIPPTSGLRFYFYPQGDGTMLSYDASSTGFEGDLPAGKYRVIACSTDARNVAYQGMESYSSASITATAGAQGRSLSYYAQPSGVYVLHLSDLTVPLQDVVETSSVPDTLSRSMNLSFLLLGGESPASLSGLIRGIQPSVFIATGQSWGETGVTSFTTVVSGNEATAGIGMLGILDPLGSLPYRNLMDLTLTLNDGTVQTTQVDLTQFLSDVLNANGGSVPIELSVEVELRLIDAQLVASVKPWNDGSGEGSVK